MSSSSSFLFSLFFFLSPICLFLCLFGNVSCTENFTVENEMHEEWMAKFDKVYHNKTEKEYRLKIFSENVKYIHEFNKAKNSSYTLAINKFTDLTNDEFVALVGSGKVINDRDLKLSAKNITGNDVPDHVDWRSVGAVTPVKDQNPCGACWAFASVASIEGLVKIKTGQLISLSEQELLDCVPVSNGCTYGYVDETFKFIVSNGGITTEADYPYTATKMTCDFNKLTDKAVSIESYEQVTANNENQLMRQVAKQPVVAYVSSAGLQHYGGGVFNGDCGTERDHFVTLVGYGTDTNGANYWIAKNSWGVSWGENGYAYLAKDISDPRGTCGLATNPMYPTY